MPSLALSLVLALFSLVPVLVTALPALAAEDEGSYRSWDFHLLNGALPTCNAHASNTDLSIFQRYGTSTRECVALDRSRYNETTVKSIMWKSPRSADMYDLCMFRTPDCSGGAAKLVTAIRNGWEVCYPFTPFRGWSVVEHGEDCFQSS